jgi:hypothetical protein
VKARRQAVEQIFWRFADVARAKGIDVTVATLNVLPRTVASVRGVMTHGSLQAGGYQVAVQNDGSATVYLIAPGSQEPYLRRSVVLAGRPLILRHVHEDRHDDMKAALQRFGEGLDVILTEIGALPRPEDPVIHLAMPTSTFRRLTNVLSKATSDTQDTIRHQKELEADAYITELESILKALAKADVEDDQLSKALEIVRDLRSDHLRKSGIIPVRS